MLRDCDCSASRRESLREEFNWHCQISQGQLHGRQRCISERTRNNGHKLQQKKSWNSLWVVKPWNRLPRKTEKSPSQRFPKPDWTRPWVMWSNFEVLEAYFKPNYVIWRSLTRFCSSKTMLLHKAVWQAHLCIQVYCHRLTIQSSMHILTIMPLEKSMLSYTNFLVLAYCQILEFALRQSLWKPWRKQSILQCHYFIVTYLNRNCMWANWNYVRAVGAKSGSS